MTVGLVPSMMKNLFHASHLASVGPFGNIWAINLCQRRQKYIMGKRWTLQQMLLKKLDSYMLRIKQDYLLTSFKKYTQNILKTKCKT